MLDLLPTQGKSDANLKTVAKTEPLQPNNAVSSDSSLSTDEQSGTSSIEPNGKSTVSERKVNNSAINKQEKNEESSLQLSDNKREQTVQTAVEAATAQVNTAPTPAQAEAGNNTELQNTWSALLSKFIEDSPINILGRINLL